jgi:hypothetical protein
LLPPGLARRLVRAYAASLPEPSPVTGGAVLDVFLRIGPRDLEVAPLALASLRRHLANPIGRVTAATPAAHVEQVRDSCPAVSIVADEDLILPEIEDAIVDAVRPGRTTWVRQQFLSVVHVSGSAERPCLVWDADTVMVRPQTLLADRTAALAISDEHHPPYFRVIRATFPDLPLPLHSSTVAHHMVMDPDLLRALLGEIEAGGCGRPWWRALLDRVDHEEASPISEYEMYGQWVRHRHPGRVRLVRFHSVALSRRRFFAESPDQWASRGTDSVSTHWWTPDDHP